MNSLETLRHYRQMTLRTTGKAQRGVKAILRNRLFLDRWQAAKILGCCVSCLTAPIYVNLPSHGKLQAFHPFVTGPKALLP